ncbi:MAG: calcium/sodium antiporter [Thiotrichales bacterium]|nr:calcium/sodium antiporter [Thiotrichales bacterium]
MLLASFGLIAGLGCLVYGADRFVTGAGSTARNIGISPLIIGLTIIGFATSAPEILVGSVAAWQGKTEIAIGNAIGSNIANISLVLGMTAAILPVTVNSKTLLREYGFMMAAIGLALLVLFDQHLSRMDGGLLLCAMGIITWLIIIFSRQSKQSDLLLNELHQELKTPLSMQRSLVYLLLGLVFLVGGAELLVRSAVVIARHFGLSDLIIGLTIIAIGTSLPELAASLMSVIKKEAELAIGNVIGSNMFNMLAVLSIPALIRPTEFDRAVLLRDYPIMLGLSLLMGWMVFIHGAGRFSRAEGVFLLVCFCAYQYLLFGQGI